MPHLISINDVYTNENNCYILHIHNCYRLVGGHDEIWPWIDLHALYPSCHLYSFVSICTHLYPLGTLHTPHGTVETPNFIFCGTKANVKGITAKQLRDAGTQFILSNTYHLFIQPGSKVNKHITQ